MIIERTPLVPGLFGPSLNDLEAHVRISNTIEEVEEALRLAAAAIVEIENYASLALGGQTIRVTFLTWPPCEWFALPIAPLIDPSSVTLTGDGAPYSEFSVVAGLRPTIRTTGQRASGVLVVEYQAGWGDTFASIPADLRHAVLDQTAANFDQRGAGDGKTNGRSVHLARVAARYRRVAL